jgi:hypothetical protein
LQTNNHTKINPKFKKHEENDSKNQFKKEAAVQSCRPHGIPPRCAKKEKKDTQVPNSLG